MTKRLTKTQRRLMLEIIYDINDETITNRNNLPEDMPAWFLDWPLWTAGENMPGYLQDSPYCLFLTERAARGYCRELERQGSNGNYVSDMFPTTLREVLAP